jgi:hypothetical protein
MTERNRHSQLRTLEGRWVSVDLTDGSCIDAELISAGRPGLQTIWLVISGADVFLPLSDVIDATQGRDS